MLALLDTLRKMATPRGRAVLTLKRADFFAVGPIGPAAQTPRAERALVFILQQPAATEILLDLTKRGSAAGQLYGLLGLQAIGYPGLSDSFEVFRERDDEVVTRTACFRFSCPMCEVAARIEDGKYCLHTHAT